MAIDNNSLCYLFDPIFQVENIRGVPIVGGHIEVFIAGTDQKYITWQNFDGARNPFKIPLNSDGRATILVEPNYTYDAYIYDSFNNMICSRLNIRPVVGGDIVVSGITQVWHDDSLSGDGTPQAPLTVVSVGKTYSGILPIVVNNDEDKISANHVALGLQEPLFFVQDDESACIIGCSAQTEIPSSVSSKWENAADTVSANSAQWNIGTVYSAGNYIDIQDDVISVTGLQPAGDYAYNSALNSKLDTTAFSTVSGSFLTALPQGTMNESAFGFDTANNITAYNGSAFKAGDEFPESATEAINVVTANSGKWNTAYLPKGIGNTGTTLSLSQGYYNYADGYSLSQGERNFTQDHSLAQGIYNSAEDESLAQGDHNDAYNHSIAQGGGNSARNYSQAFGYRTIATATGMAIGQYNQTQDAAFVIGNGVGTGNRSDSFVIDHSGNVSAQGDISASGVSLVSLYTDYQTNSATFITALPDDLAYTGWVENSIVSATSGLQPSGLYLSFNDLKYGVIDEI